MTEFAKVPLSLLLEIGGVRRTNSYCGADWHPADSNRAANIVALESYARNSGAKSHRSIENQAWRFRVLH